MTDQPKYTKGPWLRDGATVYALESCGWRKGKETFQNRFFLRVSASSSTPPRELECTARLIAAAPDLLEALKDAVRWLEGMSRDNPEFIQDSMPVNCLTMEEMKLAIAKAEGDSKE